ncbi:2-succinyl-6-hydroxy-2,4-cyclohexadiene-1-carboxylate synthase [Psychromonas antarctica]|uniref:2-succinyl-6-hydroxy-2, 4-cyclohexadiene-1-carboxylate synthase n=1 Tax=Psychromonas antarctica TaxID=67573 RepID=UPI001EE7C7F3|nr:2-succinyl-6-hydroxy-2,4-cyclohexadiene-1-carboxylate synthase [Psychromonas antarctica]MCG6200135.1 2-succinyl-6-hydroxy-2,4-cyclohexadiene-1-carboxylate synthase [Psychromonas antarctica]
MPLFSQTQGDPTHPTLVFLHGFLGSVNDWSETINHLKGSYYCVCLDLPGHGHSASITAPLEAGFTYCHRLIRCALDDLKINQYTLVGYSLGGRIALDYARTQNDPDLKNLILESAHIGLASAEEKAQRYSHDLNWAKRFATENIMQSIYEWYEQTVFSDLSCSEKDRLINSRSCNYGVCLANMLLATSLARQTDMHPFLESNHLRITALPIYYCFGEKDQKFKNLAKQLSIQHKLNVTQFDAVGHNIHQQAPLQYAQFIAKQITT